MAWEWDFFANSPPFPHKQTKKIETPGIRSLQYWQKNLQLAGNMLLPCDFMSYNGWNDENQIS